MPALSTLLFLFGLSSVLVGIVFFLLGYLELGRIVYYFPNHVRVCDIVLYYQVIPPLSCKHQKRQPQLTLFFYVFVGFDWSHCRHWSLFGKDCT
jgi:hypothetical protein